MASDSIDWFRLVRKGDQRLVRNELRKENDVQRLTLIRDGVGSTLVHHAVSVFVCNSAAKQRARDTLRLLLSIANNENDNDNENDDSALPLSEWLAVKNEQGCTCLHAAASAGFVDGVKLLLAAGADSSLRDADGLSPLGVVFSAMGNFDAESERYGQLDDVLRVLLVWKEIRDHRAELAKLRAARQQHLL
jgi:Ankyrin repeat